jgi:hypothetical protein
VWRFLNSTPQPPSAPSRRRRKFCGARTPHGTLRQTVFQPPHPLHPWTPGSKLAGR